MFNSIKELRHAGNKARITHYRHVKFTLGDLLAIVGKKEHEVEMAMIIAMKGGVAFMRHDEIRAKKLMNRVVAKGGLTRLEVTTKDGLNITTESVCCAKDNYDKKLGVKIAIGRLNL